MDMGLLLQCGFQPPVAPQHEPDGRDTSWDSSPNTCGVRKLPSIPWYPSSPLVVPTCALATWGGMGLCMLCEILVAAMRICTDLPAPARDTGSASLAELLIVFKDAPSHWPSTIRGA